jgi:hypothetical protein
MVIMVRHLLRDEFSVDRAWLSCDIGLKPVKSGNLCMKATVWYSTKLENTTFWKLEVSVLRCGGDTYTVGSLRNI